MSFPQPHSAQSREKVGFSQGCGFTQRVWQKQRWREWYMQKLFAIKFKLCKMGGEERWRVWDHEKLSVNLIESGLEIVSVGMLLNIS